MKEILNIFIIVELFHFIATTEIKDWRDFPTCTFGRLQSPIQIDENETIYANNFTFVYQSYNGMKVNKKDEKDYATVYELVDGENGGYINFERGGVIKQYKFKGFEIYPGIHKIDGDYGDYELHIIHEKNLDFITNKNQYRSIQDASNSLVIVLRYKETCNKDVKCISDDGLMDKITSSSSTTFSLGDYPIFQDKRAYFYEGSTLHIPCDENVNYYVVKDYFSSTQKPNYSKERIDISERYGRPVYKNFMNYKEVLKSNYISVQFIISFLLIFILF